jgi:lipopolysaccharide export system protein LptA
MWRSCSSLGYAVWLCAAAVQAADTAGSSAGVPSANGRTDITAKKITMRNQENKAIFEGNVVLKKGVLVVHSDVMVVFLKPGDSKAAETAPKASRKGSEELPTISNRTVSIIEATGQVKIEKADGRATSRKAVYNEDERKIILTGDPVAWQRGTCVSGKKIVMFLDDDRTIVEGGSRVMIEPEAGEHAPAACAR